MSKQHEINVLGAREVFNNSSLSDLSRNYLYSLQIPDVFGTVGNNSTLTLLCSSVQVPNYTLINKEIKIQKMSINLADGVQFSPLDITFWSDEANVIRSSLLVWSSLAYDVNRKGSAAPNKYKRTIILTQLNRVFEPICTYSLIGAYPEKIMGYELKNDGNDIVRFTTSFKYDYYTVEVVTPTKRNPTIQTKNQIPWLNDTKANR